ncbi:MAG: 1-deoxy-D-xylulose-5-phosphate reductoisomerase [Aquiluna sp.]|nr:1-deoxy-D-xylulose-5-phosphate reductoisomerase [Aquiluna sp.]
MRTVLVLGSTGSVGTQTLDLIRANPDKFKLVGISGNSNAELLASQKIEFSLPDDVVAVGPEKAAELAASIGADVVVNGITGSAGLAATLASLKAGSRLALANKESLIVGGSLVTDIAGQGQIQPVDSEHSAIAQCLLSGGPSEVSKLILTASGGPFRNWTRQQLANVTPEQALKHPTWTMGKVITTNSATMVNKGLEVIEAHLLFGVPFDQIAVTVHRQSIVHSMVEFHDGSVIAQASEPDMKLAIGYAMGWPERLSGSTRPLDFTKVQSWDFEPLDEDVFTAVKLARQVGKAGLTFPAVYNAANEEAVEAFHNGKLSFLGITDTIEAVLDMHSAEVLSLDGVLAAETWARQAANSLIAKR